MQHTSDQIHRDEYCTEGGEFRKNIIDLVVRVRHFDGNLCEIIGVRAREYLFVVVQVLRHCNQVVLYVNIRTRHALVDYIHTWISDR